MRHLSLTSLPYPIGAGYRYRGSGVLFVFALVLLAFLPAEAHSQALMARFRIEQVKDTTIVFTVGNQDWVKAGRRGQAVDPARDDEFVAEFRVISVRGVTAEAVITGQTRRVQPEHVAVMQLPSRPFWRQTLFWIAAAGGAVLGMVAGYNF